MKKFLEFGTPERTKYIKKLTPGETEEGFYDKVTLDQINNYLKGMNRLIPKKDMIAKLKKKWNLKKIEFNPMFTKILAIEHVELNELYGTVKISGKRGRLVSHSPGEIVFVGNKKQAEKNLKQVKKDGGDGYIMQGVTIKVGEKVKGFGEDRDYKSTKKAIKYHADEARNYRKEYDNYHAQPEQRERNAARLRARRQMVKAGKVEKFDKKDVHHKDNNPLNNKDDNLAVTTQNWNRTEPRLRNETFKSFVEYFHESRLDDKLDKLVSNEIKKRKLAKFPVNATDDIKMRMKPNKPAFKFPSPNSDMMIHVYLRKMTPPSKKGMMAFNYQLEDK